MVLEQMLKYHSLMLLCDSIYQNNILLIDKILNQAMVIFPCEKNNTRNVFLWHTDYKICLHKYFYPITSKFCKHLGMFSLNHMPIVLDVSKIILTFPLNIQLLSEENTL